MHILRRVGTTTSHRGHSGSRRSSLATCRTDVPTSTPMSLAFWTHRTPPPVARAHHHWNRHRMPTVFPGTAHHLRPLHLARTWQRCKSDRVCAALERALHRVHRPERTLGELGVPTLRHPVPSPSTGCTDMAVWQRYSTSCMEIDRANCGVLFQPCFARRNPRFWTTSHSSASGQA